MVIGRGNLCQEGTNQGDDSGILDDLVSLHLLAAQIPSPMDYILRKKYPPP
jgi:hypothetical protein